MEKHPRILVVDDEMSIRGILNELLTALGYEVVEAPSVEVALVKIGQIAFDLIVSDIRMAGRSGIELLKNVKESHSETEVIIMTSHASLESALEAIHLGAYDYLVKPFEELEYVEMVVSRALLQRQLKKENQALLARLTQKNEEMEKGAGRAAHILAETANFYKVSSNLLKSKNIDALMFRVQEGLALFLKGKPGIIWMYHREHGALVPYKTVGLGLLSIPPLPVPDPVCVSDTELCLWLSRGEYKVGLDKLIEAVAPKHTIHQPMIYQHRAYGLLTVLNRPLETWAVYEKNAFVHLCLIAAMMRHFFEMGPYSVSISSMDTSVAAPSKEDVFSFRDAETALLVYPYFLELLERETMRARRYRHPFTLLLLTFDGIRDQAGNRDMTLFLQEWAKLILGRIRTCDIATRDKDQIFILLPETSERESQKVSQALKKQMVFLSNSKRYLELYGEGRVNAVFYPRDGDTGAALIAALQSGLRGCLSHEATSPSS